MKKGCRVTGLSSQKLAPHKNYTVLLMTNKFTVSANIKGIVVGRFPSPPLGPQCELKPRARQNVVLEFGYFMRLLGRDRVVAYTREMLSCHLTCME